MVSSSGVVGCRSIKAMLPWTSELKSEGYAIIVIYSCGSAAPCLRHVLDVLKLMSSIPLSHVVRPISLVYTVLKLAIPDCINLVKFVNSIGPLQSKRRGN